MPAWPPSALGAGPQLPSPLPFLTSCPWSLPPTSPAGLLPPARGVGSGDISSAQKSPLGSPAQDKGPGEKQERRCRRLPEARDRWLGRGRGAGSCLAAAVPGSTASTPALPPTQGAVALPAHCRGVLQHGLWPGHSSAGTQGPVGGRAQLVLFQCLGVTPGCHMVLSVWGCEGSAATTKDPFRELPLPPLVLLLSPWVGGRSDPDSGPPSCTPGGPCTGLFVALGFSAAHGILGRHGTPERRQERDGGQTRTQGGNLSPAVTQ